MNTLNIKALSEQVQKLEASAGSGLPDVTSDDDGKILGVVNGAWDTINAPSGGVNYSTTEQNTGLTWIDGRPIYQITYTGVIARGEYDYWNKMDLGATDAVALVDMEGSLYDSNGNIIPFASSLTSSNTGYGDYTWLPRIAGGHVEIGLNNSTSAVGYNYILTLRYVKAAVVSTRSKKSTK